MSWLWLAIKKRNPPRPASYEPPVLKQETHIFKGKGCMILWAESDIFT